MARVLATRAAVLAAVLGLAATAAPASRAFAVMADAERLALKPTWPGFDARAVPVALYDGHDTWLFRHPRPPAGFAPVPERESVFRYAGLHPELRANTSAELGGVKTAAVMLDSQPRASDAELAAVVMHEAFHVFQASHHADWTANEAELFIYPADDAAILALVRLETEALRRSLAAKRGETAAAWAATAVALRRDRYSRLAEGARGYERGLELKEGLAQYVQDLALGRLPLSRSGGDAGAEDVRQRTYASGQALALILDRLAPAWRTTLEAGPTTPLDEILAAELDRRHVAAAAFKERELAAARDRANAEVERLAAHRATLRSSFQAQPGWTLVVVAADSKPLWPQGFDPLQIRRLGPRDLLHKRWLKLGNDAGAIEILGHQAITQAAGANALLDGLRTLNVAGLDATVVAEAADGGVTITGGGVAASFHPARVERSDRRVLVSLGGAPSHRTTRRP